jgi:FkbM family methyltransferase
MKGPVIRNVFDYKMYLDVFDKGLSHQLIKYRKREMDHKFLLDRTLTRDSVVLDIGANIGYYALMELNLIGPAGYLIAVEPSPWNIDLLNRNLDLNGKRDNVRVIAGAISSSRGTDTFHLASSSNLNTFQNYGTVKQHLTGEKIEVDTYRVSEVLTSEELDRGVDLIRMDVEGHEVDVINGMIDDIKSGTLSPSIIFETHISRYTKDNDMAVSLQNLFNYGYSVKYMASSWQAGTEIIRNFGYQEFESIKTDGCIRAIFEDIKPEDAIEIICNSGGARTVYLESPRAN